MAMTFGQRLKDFRKKEGYTQQDLAGLIGVSTQAVSKWETDAGMPDISQIVPLSRVFDISTDVLLGVADEKNSEEYERIYKKCMELETLNPCKWPPEPQVAEKGFRLMYDYFCSHPTNVHAAKYLLDMSELYFGKFVFFDKSTTIKECERFANCIFRFSDDADLHAEANFLMSAIYMRNGQTEKAKNTIAKMPFKYGDRAYYSAEVARLGEEHNLMQIFARQSFTFRTRFLIKSLSLVVSSPDKSVQEQIEYEEYGLRILNAVLSGGDYMPLDQVYQKLKLLLSLIKKYLSLNDDGMVKKYFEALIETAQSYLCFASTGCAGTCLMLNDDGLNRYDTESCIIYQKEMVKDCLDAVVKVFENIKTIQIENYIEQTQRVKENYSL